MLRGGDEARKLPRRRLDQFVDPHEARAVAGQCVIDRVGMPMEEIRPRLAGALAHVAGDKPRGRQRLRQARLLSLIPALHLPPGQGSRRKSGCYYSHDHSQDRPCMSPAADLNFMFDRAAECMPRADLAALQLSRLKAQLELAYAKVPHVRAKFDAAGVTPGTLKSLDDIRRFPFTTKTDMRDTYPFGLFAVPREQVVRLHASSGTTGKATVVGYTQADIDLWTDLMARCIACAGARPGDIVHNAYGYGLFTGGLGVHYGAERLGCTVVPVSGGMTERQVTLLQDFGARVLCATPSYALNIAEVAEGMGVDLRKLPVSVGIFGAEPWSDAMRRELDERLGIRAVDLYGLSEIIGPGVACECGAARDGLHGWEDHFLFEVIDPEDAGAGCRRASPANWSSPR